MTRIILIAACIMLTISAAAANPKTGVIFSGGSASAGGGAYVGALAALPGDKLGEGWAVKAAVAGGFYDYVVGGADINAIYVGGAASLVRQHSWSSGWANVSVGGRLTKTRLSPGDPANDRAGLRADVTLGADGAEIVGPWRAGWYAEAGLRDEAYFVRVNAARTLGQSRLSIGAEALRQGDPSYATTRTGALARWRLGADAELEFVAGAEFEHAAATRPYAGLAISILF